MCLLGFKSSWFLVSKKAFLLLSIAVEWRQKGKIKLACVARIEWQRGSEGESRGVAWVTGARDEGSRVRVHLAIHEEEGGGSRGVSDADRDLAR